MPTVQNRRGTAANLTSANPVLSAGEIAFETDTRRFKLGDGTTAWNSLPYVDSAVGSANQVIYKNTSNVTSGNTNFTFNDSTNTLSIQNISLTTNTISSTNTNGNLILAPNGTGDVYVDADTLRVGDSNAAATITTNGTGNLVLNTNSGTNSGSVTINQGANGNIAISPNGTGTVSIGTSLTLGTGGIVFPATSSLSSNANTLDEYEEGTWTPLYTCSTTNPTVTYSSQVGRYVRIGRAVIIHGRITITTRSGGTGNLFISGLPFAAFGNQGGYGQCVVAYKGGWTTTGPDSGYIEASLSYINLTFDNNTGHGTITIANLTAGAVDIMITGCYETTAT